MWSAVEQRWSAIHQRGREKSPAVRIGYPCCHVVSGICVLSSVLPRVSISVCVVCSLCPPSLCLITSVSLRFWPFSFFFSLSIDRKLLVPLEGGCALECYAHAHLVAQQWACSEGDKHPGISEENPFTSFSPCLHRDVRLKKWKTRRSSLSSFSCCTPSLWPYLARALVTSLPLSMILTHEYNQQVLLCTKTSVLERNPDELIRFLIIC